MAPRFSVLLPTFDRADAIGYAIRSALAQTETDFELLVVCDGCTPATADVVRSFKDARIRLFELPKAPGHGWANRNVALREARGELVAFLGDDDLFLADHLERLGDVFADHRVEWAYSRPLWISDDGTAVPLAVDLQRPADFARFMAGNLIPAPCVVHTRELLERVGYWPDHLWNGERESTVDWELWRRMVGPSVGRNLAYVPQPTCFHFRATWRNADRWAPAAVRESLASAATGWWPAALRVAPDSDDIPQAAAWRKLGDDEAGWVRELRSAVVTVVDGRAQDLTLERQRCSVLEERLAELETALADERSNSRQLETALAEQTRLAAAVITSTSWRLTSPARSAGRWIRRLASHPR